MRSSARHDARVQLLDSLALLIGCCERIGAEFPDGRRPDVIRKNTERHFLFIGEAKNTETSGCTATWARLQVYVKWLAVHALNGGTGMLALCVGRDSPTEGWMKMVTVLSDEADLCYRDSRIDRFPPDTVVLSFLF